jgi:hypothetical protein
MNSIPEVAINTIAKGSICGKHERNPPNKIPKMEQIQPIIIFFIILSPSYSTNEFNKFTKPPNY